jgi:hypothetical protein
MHFPNKLWFLLAEAQRGIPLRVLWSKIRPQNSKLFLTQQYIKHRFRSIEHTGQIPPPHFTKSLRFPLWSPMKERLRFQRLPLHVSLVVLSIGALPPGSAHSAPKERRSYSRALFCPSLKDPGKQAPFKFPIGAHMERDVRFQSDILE